jgi:YVTN family beta-propeller protein
VDVGQDPYGSASDETDEVFVANHAAGTISVVQGITVTHIITGVVQPYDVAYNPANNRIYVTDEAIGELVVINPQTHAIIKRLGGLANPRGIGIDRNTGTAYVASPGTEGAGAVRVYSLTDVDTESEGTLIPSVGVGPSWVAVDSETHQAYVTLQGEMNYGLAVIDGAIGSYPVTYVGLNAPGAFGIAYNPDNQRLYVGSGTASTLSIVDVTKIGSPENPVVAARKTDPEYNLDTVALNPTTGHVFVTGRRDLNAKAWVLDSNTNTWLDDPFNVGSYNPADPFLRGLSFDPVQGWFYVSSDFSDRVYVFDDCGD